MEKNIFKQKLCEGLKAINVNIEDKQADLFWQYFKFLLSENEKYNLTAITAPEAVISKHFLDSMAVQTEVKFKKGENIIDIGSGAGFPGVVLKIANKGIVPVLLESRLKRVNFLLLLITRLKLENEIKVIHGRAEDYGQKKNYRERFDWALARAVAPMNILVEYCLPFVKVGGQCLLYKGSQYQQELEQAQTAIKILGGEVQESKIINVPGTRVERSLVIINKRKETPASYPRRTGIPKKRPL